MQKHLLAMAQQLPQKELYGEMNITVMDVTADSRTVQPGSMFIALRGATVDGHKFIDSAVKSGAKVLVVDRLPETLPEGVGVVLVPDTREAMEILAPYFFDYPGRKLRMIGVTGTNGKTTVTNIVRLVLERAGHRAGLIGTINIVIGERVMVSHNTTPDVVDLQRSLSEMVAAGCDYCVMEVSSHALALNRVAGIEFDCGVLTNITQDHLDFHKTMDNYRDAKSLLFEGLKEGAKQGKTAVFNMDDPSSKLIRSRTSAAVLRCGTDMKFEIHPLHFSLAARGMQLDLATPAGVLHLHPKITGEFNVYNLMSAVAVLLAEGVQPELIVAELNDFEGVPGRFQLVDAGQPFTVIVDYAHTPDGLENVLKTARQITENRLWVIFGCGGDRDNTKRPLMGRLALELADEIVVTSDNPRSEDPEKILDQICVAFGAAPQKPVYRLADRRGAIHFAMEHANAGDVVLIAGKGHENYQILKDRTIHFDDCEVVREYFGQ